MNLGSQSRKFNACLWIGIQYWPELPVDCYCARFSGYKLYGAKFSVADFSKPSHTLPAQGASPDHPMGLPMPRLGICREVGTLEQRGGLGGELWE
jgi:hypothetical protein